MRDKLDRLFYFTTTALFGLLALLFLAVFITSLAKNAIDICVRIGWDWVTGWQKCNPGRTKTFQKYGRQRYWTRKSEGRAVITCPTPNEFTPF